MAKAAKTNAARLLDKAGIPYELICYEVDENDLSATHVAETAGLEAKLIYKTLVLKGADYFVCIIPGPSELDLKKAAKAAGYKSASLIAMKDLLPLTGYLRGACSPIGQKRKLPSFIDESALALPYIYVSAGQRGLQFKLKPQYLITAADLGLASLIAD